MKYEYKVIWKREGLHQRYKLFQTRAGAKDYWAFLNRTKDKVWRPHPDDAETPPIIFGPIIQIRATTDWNDFDKDILCVCKPEMPWTNNCFDCIIGIYP